MTTVIEASSHARCSASAAERWMNCPGSLNLATGKPNTTSAAAAEGTFAHSLAAEGLAEELESGVEPRASWYKGRKANVEGFEVECDQEMVDGIQVYFDAVHTHRLLDNWVEMPLADALQTWDPDLGGTADFVSYHPAKKTLRVIDFKYGAGTFVDVNDNKQAMLYALGVMIAVAQPVETVEIYIVQPRYEGVEPVRKQSFHAWQLMEFAGDVADAAKATRSPSAPLHAGPWCAKSFCPNRSDCPALEKHHHALMAQEFSAATVLAPVALSALLVAVPLVKERIKAIEEYAYQQAMRGTAIPGWKLVDKKGRRQWTNAEGVIEWAKKRAIEPFEEPTLKSPAQLEKGLKKPEKAEIAAFCATVSSGSVLVPESDARPAVSRMVTVDDFAAIGGPPEPKQLTADNLFE